MKNNHGVSITKLKRPKIKALSPERKLRFLSQYMEYYIDLWPKKAKPFESWLDSTLDKKINRARAHLIEKHWKKCWYCKGDYEFDKRLDRTKDHVVPLSKGGRDVKENRVSCCYDCNQWKSDKMPNIWLKEINSRIKTNNPPAGYDLNKLKIIAASLKEVMVRVKENNSKTSVYQLQWSFKKY